MLSIKNTEAIIENAATERDRIARKLAIEALESALKAIDPEKMIKSQLVVDGKTLKVRDLELDLEKFRHIFVVGGGKASGKMASAVESVLGESITAGVVNTPIKGEKRQAGKIELHEAGHPIPDARGMQGTRAMLDLVSSAKRTDLIICLISGGGSSLMPLPRAGITLGDKRLMTDALLKSGATINEINTVRKHLSEFKGGWLAKRAYPASILNLILSDVVGDALDSIASGPTVPDPTTFGDAIEVLRRHGLWEAAPDSVKEVLTRGKRGLVAETPKSGDEAFKRVHNIIVGNNRLAARAACEKMREEGFRSLLLTSFLEGEARHVGTVMASIAREIGVSGTPVPKPCGVIAGGETTVTVVGAGKGGRNQEVALSAAMKISGIEGSVVASLNTDGLDGPTEAAGALADGSTIARAEKKGLDANNFLVANNSYRFFSKLEDLLFTGPTGTNVNDVSIIVVV